MGTSPTKELGSSIVTQEITIDGAKIPQKLQVLGVEIVKEMNKIPYAIITIIDGDLAKRTFPQSEMGMFKPGGEVEIKVAHDAKKPRKTVYKGIIVEHGIKHKLHGGSALTIKCKDKAYRLTVGRKNTIFYDMLDSDIISQVVSEGGCSADVEATTTVHKKLIRYYSTDWDFVQARADTNSLVTIVNDGEITIKKPTVGDPTDILITYGIDLIEMDLKMDSAYQYTEVQSNCWNHAKQKIDHADGAKPAVNSQGDICSNKLGAVIEPKQLVHSTAPVTKGFIQAWSDSVFQRGHLSRIRGSIKFVGTAKALVGKTIELDAIGSRFKGDGYITKVVHTIKESQWLTEVSLGMPTKSHLETYPQASTLPASGSLPAIHGLQHGVVKQIAEDPDGEFRVLVNIPIIDKLEGEGVWARMGHYYATEDCGFVFYPEIGDEVILGFFDNDPTYPVILGSLYSSARKITTAEEHKPADPNKFKAISLQKGKMRLEFDDVDCIIKILTPHNHLIQISDKEDSIFIEDPVNVNSILLDSAGITMLADKDITMKAKGNIIMEAVKDMTAEALNISMEASVNVDIKGGAQLNAEAPIFEIKGSGMGTVDGGGMLTIKAGMVMIN